MNRYALLTYARLLEDRVELLTDVCEGALLEDSAFVNCMMYYQPAHGADKIPNFYKVEHRELNRLFPVEYQYWSGEDEYFDVPVTKIQALARGWLEKKNIITDEKPSADESV